MADDHDSAVELWQAFRHYLQVQIQATTPNSAAKLRLSNAASTSPDFPRVVFTDIRIRAGETVEVRGGGPGSLAPGQEHVMDIGIKRIEDASVTVEARVDHRQFFTVQNRATVPHEHLAPAVRKMLEAYRRFRLFERVDGFLSKLPVVTPDDDARRRRDVQGRAPKASYRSCGTSTATWAMSRHSRTRFA